MKSEKRNIVVNKIVVPPPVKKEPAAAKKPTNIFAAAQSKAKSPMKKESNSEKDSPKIKEEKTSPKKNQAAGKASAKAQPGKPSAITSFFAKPSTSNVASKMHDKSISDAASKIEKVQIKDEPIGKAKNETTNANKRQLSNTSGKANDQPFLDGKINSFKFFILDSAEDSKAAVKKEKVQAKKKMKLEPKSARSRVMQICDSSSDEDEAPVRKDAKMECDDEVAVVKKEKENKTPSPEKANANRSNGGDSSSGGRKRRIKVKKMVTRTYEDEDGFVSKY